MPTKEDMESCAEAYRQRQVLKIEERLGQGDEVHRDYYIEDVSWLISERARLLNLLTGDASKP